MVQRRNGRGWWTVVALVVIWVVLAFAAEPSTSTEFDVREGRGVAAVQARATHSFSSVTATASSSRAAWSLAGVVAVLALVVSTTGPVRRSVVAADDRLPRQVRWNRAHRRGPPTV